MKKEIKISGELYTQLLQAMENSAGSAASVDEYAEQLLQQTLQQQAGPVYKEHEEKAIKDRLKALGYID